MDCICEDMVTVRACLAKVWRIDGMCKGEGVEARSNEPRRVSSIWMTLVSKVRSNRILRKELLKEGPSMRDGG